MKPNEFWMRALAMVASAAGLTGAQAQWALGPGMTDDPPTMVVLTPTQALNPLVTPPSPILVMAPTEFFDPYIDSDYAWVADALNDAPGIPPSGTARGASIVQVDGVGSFVLTIEYNMIAYADCDAVASGLVFDGWSNMAATIGLRTGRVGGDPNRPVIVFYSWEVSSAALADFPSAESFDVAIARGTLAVNGLPVIEVGDFDRGSSYPYGILTGAGSGSFEVSPDVVFTVDLLGEVDAFLVSGTAGVPDPHTETASAHWRGSLVLSIGAPPPPHGACCLPSGACDDSLTEAECASLGGSYAGDDTACASSPPCPPACVGDIDGDGDVDLSDLALLLTAFGSCVGDPGFIPAADFDGSGCVDLNDLSVLLSHFGTICA